MAAAGKLRSRTNISRYYEDRKTSRGHVPRRGHVNRTMTVTCLDVVTRYVDYGSAALRLEPGI